MAQYDGEGKYQSLASYERKAGLCATGARGLDVTAGGVLILGHNGGRVFATIRNMTDRVGETPADLWITLGALATILDNPQSMTLHPGDVFVIDRDHPWSGDVCGITELGVTSGVDVLEVSLA